MSNDIRDLEAVPKWDGDETACAWCGDNKAAVCIEGDPVCATCHTIAYEQALIRDRKRLRAITLAAEKLAKAVARVTERKVSPATGGRLIFEAEILGMERALAAYRKAVGDET